MRYLYTSLLLVFLINLSLDARPPRVGQIPWGSKFSCAGCHIGNPGDGVFNSLGQQVFSDALIPQNSSGVVQWGTLALLDADGDGAKNGEELQDLTGTWSEGQANPGDENLVTDPNDPSDFPTGIEEEIEITSDFAPNPAIGQSTINLNLKKSAMLSIKVYDMNGNFVNSLSSGFKTANNYSFTWNGKNLDGNKVSSGSFIVIINNGNFTLLKKVIIL